MKDREVLFCTISESVKNVFPTKIVKTAVQSNYEGARFFTKLQTLRQKGLSKQTTTKHKMTVDPSSIAIFFDLVASCNIRRLLKIGAM